MRYSLLPQQALKFVILKNGNEYLWLFSYSAADTHASIVSFVGDSFWEPVAGGFYCFKVGGAISKTISSYFSASQPTLELFGYSDSFGMSKDVYEAARYALLKQIGDSIVIDEQLFRLI